MGKEKKFDVGEVVWVEYAKNYCDIFVVIEVKENTLVVRNSSLYMTKEVSPDVCEHLTPLEMEDELGYYLGK